MKYDSEADYMFLVSLFEKSNDYFLKEDNDLFCDDVSERTLCGALKRHLENKKCRTKISAYKVDVEYNRNEGKIKTIINELDKIVSINCDLIIHSRGKIIEQDNLLAIEMKKSYRSKDNKQDDKNRLIALTKSGYDDIWSYDGKTFPEHVCRYILGVYYEVDLENRRVLIEYYRQGKLVSNYEKELEQYKQGGISDR